MPEITFNNKKIHYLMAGSGKPIVFIHGFGEDGRIWKNQVTDFSKTNTVIVPDLPGSGESETLGGIGSMSLYAEVIRAIIEKEILQKSRFSDKLVTLIGHSMGGYITLAFAQKYQQLLNGFGLFHSSAFADNPEKIETRNKAIDFIEKNGNSAYLKTSVPNLFSEKTREEKPNLIAELLQAAETVSAEALIQYTKAMIARPDTTAVLKTFSGPVLFMIGKHDQAVPLQASLQQCSMPSVSCIHILSHSGHLGMWEEEKLSNAYLRHFFNFITDYQGLK